MNKNHGMMPGQAPYAVGEKEAEDKLLNAAAEAAEEFTEDELEEYAKVAERRDQIERAVRHILEMHISLTHADPDEIEAAVEKLVDLSMT